MLTVSLVAAVPGGDFAHFEHYHHLQRYQLNAYQLNASRLAAGRWNAPCTCCVIYVLFEWNFPQNFPCTPKQPYRARTFRCHRPKLDVMSA